MKKIKTIPYNKTRLQLKDPKRNGWGPDPGKMLMAAQKYLRKTSQAVED